MINCDLKIMLKHQMKGLGKVKYLDLLGNRLEKLDSNTFENTPNLIEIMLNNNKIKFIGYELLHPLKHLEIINLGGNICTISHANSPEEMKRLNDEIKLKCSDISMFDLMMKMNFLQHKIDDVLRHIEGIASKN
jgi:DNA-directed RNA polymerase subunit L